MSVPKLNDGKIYVVTASDGKHLGDYRTFEEALVVARRYGAIVPQDQQSTLSGVDFNTYQGGSIHIGVEFVDPLLR